MREMLLILLSLACSACIGAPAFLLCRPFADLRGRRWQKALMLVGLGSMGSLPICGAAGGGGYPLLPHHVAERTH